MYLIKRTGTKRTGTKRTGTKRTKDILPWNKSVLGRNELELQTRHTVIFLSVTAIYLALKRVLYVYRKNVKRGKLKQKQ
jgi:hypothetical protein